jgi:hypothetical protein
VLQIAVTDRGAISGFHWISMTFSFNFIGSQNDRFYAQSHECGKRLSDLSCLSASLSVSVRLHGATRLPLDGFSLNLIFEYYSKICLENSSFVKV